MLTTQAAFQNLIANRNQWRDFLSRNRLNSVVASTVAKYVNKLYKQQYVPGNDITGFVFEKKCNASMKHSIRTIRYEIIAKPNYYSFICTVSIYLGPINIYCGTMYSTPFDPQKTTPVEKVVKLNETK